jgi:hypothetical protein
MMNLAACLLFVLTLAITTLCCGCASKPPKHSYSHQVKYHFEADPLKFGDDFNWQAGSPIDFLEQLKREIGTYTVVGIHCGWITATDVSPLMARLDSKVSCAAVTSVINSQLKGSISTEGREVAFLLEGFRTGCYPPALSSFDLNLDEEKLREWYKEWAQQTQIR